METTDDLVREIGAREAIRDLSARYCDCIWRKDIDGLVSLFTEEGTFRVEGLEIEAAHTATPNSGRCTKRRWTSWTRLFIHSQIVDLLGANRATGR